MKKKSFIFIVLFFLVISVCNYGLFNLFLNNYKIDFRTHIDDKTERITDIIQIKTSQLYINFNKIKWEDDNQEVRINGFLYDIASIDTKDSISELFLVLDDEETEIKKKFALIYDDEFAEKSNSPIQIVKQFLAIKYLNSCCIFKFLNSQPKEYEKDNIILCLTTVYLSVKTPPPNYLT